MNFSDRHSNFSKETNEIESFEVTELSTCSYIISMTIYSLAIILHATGLSALYLHKTLTNQKMILFNLSLAEILICITGIVGRTNEEFEYLEYKAKNALFSVHMMSIFELILTMYLLTVDRLVFVIGPFQYKSRVTNRKIRIAASLTWISSLILALATLSDKAKLIIYYFFMGATGGYVILAIITYSIILFTLRRSNENLAQSASGRNMDSVKQYLLPGVIILTFLFLYTIPASFRTYWAFERKPSSVKFSRKMAITRNFLIFGLTLDPLTYIFLSKQYRDVIIKCCVCRGKTKSQNSNATNREV